MQSLYVVFMVVMAFIVWSVGGSFYSSFTNSCPDCTSQLFTWLQYWKVGVRLISVGIHVARENLPFLSVLCSQIEWYLQCAVQARNRKTGFNSHSWVILNWRHRAHHIPSCHVQPVMLALHPLALYAHPCSKSGKAMLLKSLITNPCMCYYNLVYVDLSFNRVRGRWM